MKLKRWNIVLGTFFCTILIGISQADAATSSSIQDAQNRVAQDPRLKKTTLNGKNVYSSVSETVPSDVPFDLQQAIDDYQIKPEDLRPISNDDYPNNVIFGSLVKLDKTGFYEFFENFTDKLNSYIGEFDASGNLMNVTPIEEGTPVLISGLRSSEHVAQAQNVIKKYCDVHGITLEQYYEKNKADNPNLQKIIENGDSEVSVVTSHDSAGNFVNSTFKINYVDASKSGDLAFDSYSGGMSQQLSTLNRKYSIVKVNERYSDGTVRTGEYVTISGRTLEDLQYVYKRIRLDYLITLTNATLAASNPPTETSDSVEFLPLDLNPGQQIELGANNTFLNQQGMAQKNISGNSIITDFGISGTQDWDTLGKQGTTFQKVSNTQGTTDLLGVFVSPDQKAFAGKTTYNKPIFDAAMGAKRVSEDTYFSGLPKLTADAFAADFTVDFPSPDVDPRPPGD